jgi:hypothetical protein
MSLIYIGTEETNQDCSVEALYHNMEVEGPFWPRTTYAKGQIRYELFINVGRRMDTIYIAIPHEDVRYVQDASDTFLENFSQRLIGDEKEEVFSYNEDSYTLCRITTEQVTVLERTFDGIDYTLLEISNIATTGNIALSFQISVDRVARNVADSLFSETTWSLDITLYGPVNPREHSFLNIDKLNKKIMEVETGYSYLYLPENTFPRTVSPTPLESFFRESENRFYYTWVSGNLDPWYEQRMMITYGSHQGNYITAIIISIIASLLLLIITNLPDFISIFSDLSANF